VSEIRIETLGCRLNQIESESAARIFVDKGFSVSMEGLTSGSQEDKICDFKMAVILRGSLFVLEKLETQ
jgi:hypothetical protein